MEKKEFTKFIYFLLVCRMPVIDSLKIDNNNYKQRKVDEGRRKVGRVNKRIALKRQKEPEE
jgi:hypothetical protein